MNIPNVSSPCEVVFTYTQWTPQTVRQQEGPRLWAIAPLQDERWTAILDHPGGNITSEAFTQISEIVLKYKCEIKITTNQQMTLIIPDQALESVLTDLKGLDIAVARHLKGLRAVTVCTGSHRCKHSLDQHSQQLAKELAQRFREVVLPWNITMGFAGCKRNCTAAKLNSLGFIATPEGYEVTVGGLQLGANPVQGQFLTKCSAQALPGVVDIVLKAYIYYADMYLKEFPNTKKIRLHDVVSHFGIATFQGLVGTVKPSDVGGFSKETAFNAFLGVDKACPQCQPCSKSKCQLYIAKALLTEASNTGSKQNEHLPPDFLEMLRTLPIVDRGISHFHLQEAYQSALVNCDRCGPKDHFSFCSVNLTVTALGILLYGSKYISEADEVQQTAK